MSERAGIAWDRISGGQGQGQGEGEGEGEGEGATAMTHEPSEDKDKKGWPAPLDEGLTSLEGIVLPGLDSPAPIPNSLAIEATPEETGGVIQGKNGTAVAASEAGKALRQGESLSVTGPEKATPSATTPRTPFFKRLWVRVVAAITFIGLVLSILANLAKLEEWWSKIHKQPNVTSSGSAASPADTALLIGLESLENMEYWSEWSDTGKIRLVNGVYQGKPFTPGAATKTEVHLDDRTASGDLNGDGLLDATVVLVTNGGGSGTFYHLAAVINDHGVPKHVASVDLGDRIELRSVGIEEGVISVDMVTQGPRDPMVKPTKRVHLKYRLDGHKLVPAK